MTTQKEQAIIFALGIVTGLLLGPHLREFMRPNNYHLYTQDRYIEVADAGLDPGYDYSADTGKPGYYADTGKGSGGDHSTSALIDFSPIPARQVGSYANNLIPADQFAYELKRQGDLFGTCLIGPEKNSESGGSCLTTLKMIYPVDFIYRQIPMDRITDKPSGTGELGWETNTATKYTILNDLRTAVEDGLLIVNDKRILMEMRSFTHSNADELGSTRQGHFTKHFDLLMALAIAWAMRKHARVKEIAGSDYQQQPWEEPGL